MCACTCMHRVCCDWVSLSQIYFKDTALLIRNVFSGLWWASHHLWEQRFICWLVVQLVCAVRHLSDCLGTSKMLQLITSDWSRSQKAQKILILLVVKINCQLSLMSCTACRDCVLCSINTHNEYGQNAFINHTYSACVTLLLLLKWHFACHVHSIYSLWSHSKNVTGVVKHAL